MKKVIFSMLLPLLVMVVISSCKKIDESVVPSPSYAEMITAHKWKLTAYKQTYSGYTYDLYSESESCERDNYYVYSSDGAAYQDEGNTKCDFDDEQRITYKWSLSDDQTEFNERYYIEGYGSYTVSYNIKELTSEKMIVTYKESGYTYTLTYENK